MIKQWVFCFVILISYYVNVEGSNYLYTLVAEQVNENDWKLKAQKYNFMTNTWLRSQDLLDITEPVNVISSLYAFNGNIYAVVNINPSQFDLIILNRDLTIISRKTFNYLLSARNMLVVNKQGIFISAVKKDVDQIRYGFLLKCSLSGDVVNAKQIGNAVTKSGYIGLCMQNLEGSIGLFGVNLQNDRLSVLNFSSNNLEEISAIPTQIPVEDFNVGLFAGPMIYFGTTNQENINTIYAFRKNNTTNPTMIALNNYNANLADMKTAGGKLVALLWSLEKVCLVSILPQGEVLNSLCYSDVSSTAPGLSMAEKNNELLLPSMVLNESGIFGCINQISSDVKKSSFFGFQPINRIFLTLNTFIAEDSKIARPIVFQRGIQ